MNERFRDALGDQFESLKAHAERSSFLGEKLSTLDRDELFAMVGWLGSEFTRQRTQAAEMFDMIAATRKSA